MLFSLVIIWYISNYGIPPYIFYLFHKYYHKYDNILKFVNFCNHMISPDYFSLNEVSDKESNEDQVLDKTKELPKPPPKYEDKYLEDIRKLNKEFKFTELEEEKRVIKYLEFYKHLNDTLSDDIEKTKNKINDIEEMIKKYEASDDDYCDYDDGDDEEDFLVETKEQRIQRLINKKINLQNQLLFYVHNMKQQKDKI